MPVLSSLCAIASIDAMSVVYPTELLIEEPLGHLMFVRDRIPYTFDGRAKSLLEIIVSAFMSFFQGSRWNFVDPAGSPSVIGPRYGTGFGGDLSFTAPQGEQCRPLLKQTDASNPFGLRARRTLAVLIYTVGGVNGRR